MILSQVFKKVRCEAGLSVNAWVVQGGAMHWQKMGWRRGASASLHKVFENWWNKGLNMSLVILLMLWMRCSTRKIWETGALLFVPYLLSLPSLAGLCSSCPPVTSSQELQALGGFPALLHSPATADGDSKGCCGHTLPRDWMKTLSSFKTRS